MSDNHPRSVIERLFSDADVARAILPYMAEIVPNLEIAIGRAADIMIEKGDLPTLTTQATDAIEALHDLGHTLVGFTEAMGRACQRPES